jgi:hypothetical protein
MTPTTPTDPTHQDLLDAIEAAAASLAMAATLERRLNHGKHLNPDYTSLYDQIRSLLWAERALAVRQKVVGR